MTWAETPRLYNSLTRSVESLPSQARFGLYVCGITPYDAMHLGHAFTYTFFDVLVRYLRFLGHQVTYVQNITDVDDSILRKAAETGRNWKELGDSEVALFLEQMTQLNNVAPNVMPRATEHIAEMHQLAQDLLAKGLAYERDGNVYFEVAKAKALGQLDRAPYRQKLELANANGNTPDDPLKRDPLDFVLWQRSKAGEPRWESPWGEGRPGWHIECSAMSMKYLGETFALHGGGRDLLFPHHDCEILQSENATGQPFVWHWVHTGLARMGGEKMSKSLGNMAFTADLLSRYSSDALRLYLLDRPYREDWDYREEDLRASAGLADELAAKLRNEEELSPDEAVQTGWIFVQALHEGFDTQDAIRALAGLARAESVQERGAARTLARQVLGLRLGQTAHDA